MEEKNKRCKRKDIEGNHLERDRRKTTGKIKKENNWKEEREK